MSKKVIPVICEGQSDAIALQDYLSFLFRDKNIEFVVCGGDILGDDESYEKEIDELLSEVIFTPERPVDFSPSDILMIVHLIDTDGIFVDDSKIVLDTKLNFTHYYDDSIAVTKSVPATIETRNKRRERINECIRKREAIIKGCLIKYRLFYMSCNLEHVTHNERNVGDQNQKLLLAEYFSERFMDDVNEFVQFLEEHNQSKTHSFEESWKFIKKHSLDRTTNLIILISEFDDLLR